MPKENVKKKVVVGGQHVEERPPSRQETKREGSKVLKIMYIVTNVSSLSNTILLTILIFSQHWVVLVPLPGEEVVYTANGRLITKWSRSLWSDCLKFKDKDTWSCELREAVSDTELDQSFDPEFHPKLQKLTQSAAIWFFMSIFISLGAPIFLTLAFLQSRPIFPKFALLCFLFNVAAASFGFKYFTDFLTFSKEELPSSKINKFKLGWGPPLYFAIVWACVSLVDMGMVIFVIIYMKIQVLKKEAHV